MIKQAIPVIPPNGFSYVDINLSQANSPILRQHFTFLEQIGIR